MSAELYIKGRKEEYCHREVAKLQKERPRPSYKTKRRKEPCFGLEETASFTYQNTNQEILLTQALSAVFISLIETDIIYSILTWDLKSTVSDHSTASPGALLENAILGPAPPYQSETRGVGSVVCVSS